MGFRPKRNTPGKICIIRLLIEKHLQHQHHIYHNFIKFSKAINQVWHERLWQVMRNYNIDDNMIQVIEALYRDSSIAVLLNSHLREFFKTTVRVYQGCLLSLVLFNISLESIMQEMLNDFTPAFPFGVNALQSIFCC